ncbi:MAG: ABC transporter permease [Candidatus Bathyarchaeia archaeon]
MITPTEQHASKLHGLWALTNRELKKWYKEPVLLFLSIIQPIIWMGLFGKTMNLGALFTRNPSIPPHVAEQIMKQTFGTSNYFSFMAVGMVSFVVLFTTMFSGMSIVWDRRLGFLDKVLSTPVSRGVIIFSKVLSATLRSIVQVTIVLLIALLLGFQPSQKFNLLNVLGVLVVIFLICVGLSSLFLFIAIKSTRWETPMAVANLINLPLMFASNAFFPISMMPKWLQTIATVNPLTYTTDAVRQLLLYDTNVTQFLIDLTYLGIFAALFASIGLILSWKYLSK